jgi:hypothetical protein
MALAATEQNRRKKKKEERESEVSENKIIKKMKWQMNSVRHKWLATVAKTHFASRETHPLGAIFWACELYLSLFCLLANPLGMLLVVLNVRQKYTFGPYI